MVRPLRDSINRSSLVILFAAQVITMTATVLSAATVGIDAYLVRNASPGSGNVKAVQLGVLQVEA